MKTSVNSAAEVIKQPEKLLSHLKRKTRLLLLLTLLNMLTQSSVLLKCNHKKALHIDLETNVLRLSCLVLICSADSNLESVSMETLTKGTILQH